jgi:hypothetical protein
MNILRIYKFIARYENNRIVYITPTTTIRSPAGQHNKRERLDLQNYITKDLIKYHLLPLLDDSAAIQLFLSSHHMYGQYYTDYKMKSPIDGDKLCEYASKCSRHKHQYPVAAERVYIKSFNQLKTVLLYVPRI